jgi:tRNA (guanine37-N1)-methyltransferase
MKFEVITLFPDYFSQSLKQSLIGKAVEKELFDIDIINLRDFADDKHRTVDDTPYGGGGGMVMMLKPLDNCLKKLGYEHKSADTRRSDSNRIVLTSAAGKKFDQLRAIEYSLCDRLTIICGHYLGIDERTTRLYEMDELSVGDYILTGGEPAAMVIVDAVARLIPKVLGNFESAMKDSFMDQLLGAPSYTRPNIYQGLAVPRELLSGDHKVIEKFRRREAIRKCLKNRRDLLQGADLSDDEIAFIKTLDDRIDLE